MRIVVYAVLCTVILAPNLGGEEVEIVRLHPKDSAYSAQQEGLVRWNRALAQQHEVQDVVLYRYATTRPRTVIALASSFGVPYSTFATLNRFSRNAELPIGSVVMIPTASGLFIPLEAENDLERLMYETRVAEAEERAFVPVHYEREGGIVGFLLLPGEDFSLLERTAFFGRLFQNPVRSGRISSFFGPRPDPFTGASSYHYGVDFATAKNENIYAAREGTVQRVIVGDIIYGNYIIVSHEGGFETLYAHLNSVLVQEGQRVRSGTVLGTVGNTGHSTGPHVHFEVHHYGRALDPAIYLKKLDRFLYAGAEKETVGAP